MKLICKNDNCIMHNKDDSCSRDSVTLGKQGVCTY